MKLHGLCKAIKFGIGPPTFLLGLFFDPEDRGTTFPRNVGGLLPKYTPVQAYKCNGTKYYIFISGLLDDLLKHWNLMDYRPTVVRVN
jgi:hypothetical protein